MIGGTRITSGLATIHHNIAVTNVLTGASAALWTAPVIMMIQGDVPHDLFSFALVLTSAASLVTLLLGVVYRSQLHFRSEQQHEYDLRRQDVAATRSDIAALRQLFCDLQLYSQASDADLAARIDRVASRVERDRWNTYTEAAADLQGGEAVIDATETRRIPAGTVTKLPTHRINGSR